MKTTIKPVVTKIKDVRGRILAYRATVEMIEAEGSTPQEASDRCGPEGDRIMTNTQVYSSGYHAAVNHLVAFGGHGGDRKRGRHLIAVALWGLRRQFGRERARRGRPPMLFISGPVSPEKRGGRGAIARNILYMRAPPCP